MLRCADIINCSQDILEHGTADTCRLSRSVRIKQAEDGSVQALIMRPTPSAPLGVVVAVGAQEVERHALLSSGGERAMRNRRNGAWRGW